MPFSPSSSLDCMILQGIRTFSGTGSGRIEFGLTLVVVDGIEGIWGCDKGVGARIGCGKGGSSLAMALLFSSSSSSSCIHVLAWFGRLRFISNLHATFQGDSFSNVNS
ncbi:hypothetical protein PS1_023098 [Malus domestica]